MPKSAHRLLTLSRFAVLACVGGLAVTNAAEPAPSAADPRPADAETAVEHPVELPDPIAPAEPVRTYTVTEHRDDEGLPREYSLQISTPVCMDGKCKPIEVTMVWTALGYYERLDVPPEKPLTKKEHTPFDPEDYVKLDRILRNPASVLGKHSLAFMVQRADDAAAPPETAADGERVDAWTGPTPVTVQQSVVKDAAYTTWVMWRWANGEITERLRGLTRESCTPAFIKRLLRSGDVREVEFALEHLLEHSPHDGQYVDDAFHVLEQGDRKQVGLALRFLTGAVEDRQKLHARLAESCCRMKQFCSAIVLDYFAAQRDLPETSLDELTARLDRLPYFQIHLILRLLEDRGRFTRQTESDVAELLDSEDFFIARRASEFLAGHDLGQETRRRVEAFRRKNRERL